MLWQDTAAAQDGVITRAQLRTNGMADATITRLVGRGRIAGVASGVFLVRGAPLSYRARLWAAVLSTDGLLGFATGAQLWGVIDQVPDRVHVVLPHARRVYPPSWVRVHRVPVAPRAVRSVSGLPATSRSWTVLDHIPTLRFTERSRLADRALQRGWFTADDLERRLREYPGRAGNRALRLIASQLGDGAAAESERVLHRLLRQAGITGWTPNYPAWANGELVGVIDVALVERHVAIEIDGWAYHSDVDRFQRDRARQNDLIMLGWRVLRFTWADLTERPGYVRAMIRGAAA